MLYQLSYFRMAWWPAQHHIDASRSHGKQSLSLPRSGRSGPHYRCYALRHLSLTDLVDGARHAVVLEHQRRRLVVLPALDREAAREGNAEQVRLPLTVIGH